ncbi:MAG TPA: 3-mercaptopyruvate sulfurtransferase [Acidisphaera sp.]|nr:3-mercaptopyruvate sulfurtransferase [Acidisphaera sp.]
MSDTLPGPLVDTDWLAAHLGHVMVFDATKFLPNQNRDGRAEYLAAHIPGAGYFDIDAIADADTDLPHMVPAPGRFAKLVGALGIGNDSAVIFYDNNDMMWASRAWWMLGTFGHDNAAVLDGGLAKWRAEGRPVEAGTPPAPTPATFRPDFRARHLRGIGDMLRNVRTQDELVLDARGAPRFHAQVPEPRAGMRSGHIPGSANLPYADLLTEAKTLRPSAELRARFAQAGVDGSRAVVTSCGSGVSATVLTLGMVLAGLPEGAVYDGSWTEWGGRPDTPIET